MNSRLSVVIAVLSLVTSAYSQLWDIFESDELDEDSDDDPLQWLNEYSYDNTTEGLFELSTAHIDDEREILEQGLTIIYEEMEEIYDVADSFSESKLNDFNDFVFEHNIQLYNVISETRSKERENSRKFIVKDVQIWKNVSDEDISKMIDIVFR
jgi:hypothetical protein